MVYPFVKMKPHPVYEDEITCLELYTNPAKPWESISLLRMDFGGPQKGRFVPLSLAGVRHSFKSPPCSLYERKLTDDEIVLVQQALQDYYDKRLGIIGPND